MNETLPSIGALRSLKGTRGLACLTAAAVAFTLTGCGKSENAADAPASQVAAKVDGTEISVHQINHLLTRSNVGADSANAAKSLRKQVLDKLIDQQLLVEKAIEDKLDRSPDVQMSLELARRDVLANAYVQQINPPTKPAEAQARSYYAEHPELFAKRRVFQLQEITLPASTPADVQAALKAIVEGGKPIDELTKALNARGVEFARADSQRPSEQISLELLPRVYSLREGQGLIANAPQTVTALYMKSYEDAPMTEAAALPRIAQFLAAQNLNQNLADLVKKLRANAKIDYLGEFADGGPASAK